VKREIPAADDVKPEVPEETDELAVEEDPDAAEGDEALIEVVEDDAPDVTGIIDAPIEPDEKT
jgi:hypothetical protein